MSDKAANPALNPAYVPGPWLKEQITQAITALLVRQGDGTLLLAQDGCRGLLVVPLGGLVTDAGSEEDKTCDKCRKVFPDGLFAFSLTYPKEMFGVRLMISGGFCGPCAEQEGMR